ncbi:YoaK family protein [Salinicoccus sesuvii]|uniref:YoaK family protein n=1 Tax=Salinicoccus sesuvii TaxID=868281 RepID=A0ABV7N1R3_9STAP
MSKESEPLYISTTLTVIACFLMGFIDAYTFLQQDEVFVSAQTGNLISLSAKLFSGEWRETSSHIWSFVGFAIGAFVGEAVLDRYQKKGMKRYSYYLLIQTILLLALALFQQRIIGGVMLFSLGLLAGYELTIFRKFRGTAVNNGIMTGNTKNLMGHLYQLILKRDSAAKTHLTNLSAIILIFVLGAGVGTLTIQFYTVYHLWGAFLISLIAFTWSAIHPTLSAK